MSDPGSPVEYFYEDKVIDSDQLSGEINAVSELEAKFSYINTIDDDVYILFSSALTSSEEASLDSIVEAHEPEEEGPPSLPEYSDNAAAISDGLSVGAFYRTGEFVKIVY